VVEALEAGSFWVPQDLHVDQGHNLKPCVMQKVQQRLRLRKTCITFLSPAPIFGQHGRVVCENSCRSPAKSSHLTIGIGMQGCSSSVFPIGHHPVVKHAWPQLS
jgi:hypothetical protein